MTNDENHLPISEDLLIALKPRETLSKTGVEIKYNPKYCSTNWYIPFKVIRWKDREIDGVQDIVGRTPFGNFYIAKWPHVKSFEISRSCPICEHLTPGSFKALRLRYPTLEGAKQACQEAFEVAILQCLGEDDDKQD